MTQSAALWQALAAAVQETREGRSLLRFRGLGFIGLGSSSASFCCISWLVGFEMGLRALAEVN